MGRCDIPYSLRVGNQSARKKWKRADIYPEKNIDASYDRFHGSDALKTRCWREDLRNE